MESTFRVNRPSLNTAVLSASIVILAVLLGIFLIFPGVASTIREALGSLLGEQAANVVTVVSGLIVIGGAVIALLRKMTSSSGNESREPASTAQDDRSVTAGRDITGPVVTGNHNQLTFQTGEERYERLRPEVVPVRLGSAPPTPDVFVGRSEVLAEFRARLGQSAEQGVPEAPMQVLTAIHGWPGVGKTAVAAALAHDEEVGRMFPDGVLFASLGQEPELLSTILGFARALGDDLSDAGKVEEASARLAAMLRERRVLVILDDVWEAAHALPLTVGGRRCMTLATTRLDRVARELSPQAEGVYRLGVLSKKAAFEVLEQLAPAVVTDHPEKARELVRELDGLPLALRVAGGLLAAETGAGFGANELLEELRESKRLLEAEAPPSRVGPFSAEEVSPTVAALLRRSTNRLESRLRERFALLGVLPGRPTSFDGLAAKNLWELTGSEDPRLDLRSLVDRGLLEPTGGARFQIHSLLGAFARSLLEEMQGPAGIVEARGRYLANYQAIIQLTNLLYGQGGDYMKRGLEIFDADWEAIRAAHAMAVSLMEEDDEAARFVSDYASAGSLILAFRMEPRERIQWMEVALSAAHRLGDRDAERAHNINLGTAYSMAGDPLRALPHFEQGLTDAREAGDHHLETTALGNLASSYAGFGDHLKAVELATECLTISRESGDSRSEAQACGTLGSSLADLGKHREAVRYLKAQRDIARDLQVRDLPSEARALRKLGMLYRELQYFWRAAVMFEASASVFEELGDHLNRHGVLLGHAYLCAQREEYNDAIRILDRVIESAQQQDDGGAKASALMNKGNVQDSFGRRDAAISLYRRAISTAYEVGDRDVEGDASWNLAQLLESEGDPYEAISAAQDALTAYRAIGSPKEQRVAAWLDERNAGTGDTGAGR